ncbi:MAG: hypothetical protein ACOYBR_09710 [Fluviibacter sp.]
MATSIDEKIIITGDSSALRRALAIARNDMVKFGNSGKNAATEIAKGFIGATGALNAIKIGFTQLRASTVGAFNEYVEFGDTIATFATRTGVATDELQRLAFIAEQTDTELSPLVEGLSKLARNAAEAASGNKGLADAFAALGVSVTDANGQLRSRTDLMQDVATATAELGTAEDRTAALTAVMGRGAEQFAGVMEALADSAGAVSAAFDKFIIPLTPEDIARAGELDNIFLRVNAQMANASQRASALIAPEVAALAEEISDALLSAQREGSALQQVFEEIGRQLSGVGVTLDFWRDTMYDVGRALGLISEAGDKLTNPLEQQLSIAESITLAVARGRDLWQGVFSLIETTGLRVMNGYLSVYAKLLDTIVQVGGAFSESIVKPASDAAAGLRAQIAANERTIGNSQISVTDTANVDAARAQIEAARFEQMKRIVDFENRTRDAANATGKKGDGTKAFRKPQGDDESAALKAADDARLKLIQDGRKRELAALERAYDDQLVTTADYYRRRREIEQAGIADEIALNERAQSRVKSQIAKASTAADKNKGRAELEKLRSEGEILRRESVTQIELLEREQRQAYEAYNQRITSVIAELATAQGQQIEVEFAKVETELNGQLRDAIQNGDAIGQQAIEQLRTLNAARLDAARTERDLQTSQIKVQSQRATLDIQHERGLLTTVEYEREIFELENQTLAIERDRLNARIALAQASGDTVEVERLQAELAGIEAGFNRMTSAQLEFQSTFKSSFSEFFSDTIKGVDDTETRLRNLIGGFFDSFLKQASDDMAESLYKSIVTPIQQGTQDAKAPVDSLAGYIVSALGGAFGGGSGGGWLSKLFGGGDTGSLVTGALTNTTGMMDTGDYGGLAAGGPVRGKGSNISDSILARLSNGEYVQPARAVSHYGQSVMDALRSLAIPRATLQAITSNAGNGLRDPSARRFADGGLVGTTGQSQGIGTPSIVIENRGTPQRVRSVESEGADASTVIRIVTEDIRNNGAAAQAIAGTFRLQR